MSQAHSLGASKVLLEDLVCANRILARYGVLDGFGHVSARSADRPDRFHLARSMAPALVTAEDLLLFGLDSEAIGPAGHVYLERFIHGEIYKARPDVGAVLHCHTPIFVSFGAAGQALKPVYHMAGAIGQGCAHFEIRDHDPAGGNMLVTSPQLGAALAGDLAANAVVLMRGHGATIVAPTVRQAVFRAIYLQINASIQLASQQVGRTRFLSAEEASWSADIVEGSVDRAWEGWLSEIG